MRHDDTERIIGIDPGSIRCGVGIVERQGKRVIHIHAETIECGRGDFSERLAVIYEQISALCVRFSPTRASIEGIFHYRNADSALKLGHARGVALLALTHAKLDVQEYQPSEIKKAVGSYGAADKEQVRQMVMRLLQLTDVPGYDASDALAIAMTAAYRRPVVAGATQPGGGLARAIAAAGAGPRRSSYNDRIADAVARQDALKARR